MSGLATRRVMLISLDSAMPVTRRSNDGDAWLEARRPQKHPVGCLPSIQQASVLFLDIFQPPFQAVDQLPHDRGIEYASNIRGDRLPQILFGDIRKSIALQMNLAALNGYARKSAK